MKSALKKAGDSMNIPLLRRGNSNSSSRISPPPPSSDHSSSSAKYSEARDITANNSPSLNGNSEPKTPKFGGVATERLAEFALDPRFKKLKTIGYGDYGFLAIAEDLGNANQVVAVRKTYNVFRDIDQARELARELHVLRSLGHPNAECLIDVFPSPGPGGGGPGGASSFQDLFCVTRAMDGSLGGELGKRRDRAAPLPDQFVKNVFYQVLCGLRHLHSAGVVHRELRSISILLRQDGLVQISNFQAARSVGELTGLEHDRFVGLGPGNPSPVRAPEMLLRRRFVTAAADVWGVGCNLWEALGGPRQRFHQLGEAFGAALAVGGVDPTQLGYANPEGLAAYLQTLEEWPALPEHEPFAWPAALPRANPVAVHLLERMLRLRPEDRITVEEALRHPYLLDADRRHEADMDRDSNQLIHLGRFYQQVDSEEQARELLLGEIQGFRPPAMSENSRAKETGAGRRQSKEDVGNFQIVDCQGCQTGKRDGDKFCRDCGSPLFCEGCNIGRRDGDNFCRDCGAHLHQANMPPPVPTKK